MGGLVLPEFVGTASSAWQLVDFLRLRLRSAAAAGGVARIDVAQLPDNELWVIDRAVVSSSSTNTTALRLYDSYVDPEFFLSGSGSGNFDEADYPGGLQVPPTASLIAEWTGCSDGAIGRLYLQGRRLQRSS